MEIDKTGTIKIGQREFDIRIRDNKTAQLAEAHNRANERTQQNNQRRRRSAPRRQGSVNLSNTDSVGRATRIRSRLRAKLGEIMSSSLDDDIKKSLARTVQLQIDRVDRKIIQIRRRERAKVEERRERRNQERQNEERRVEIQREAARRRRRNDMRQRSIRVRREFLYPASQGGFDPYNKTINGGSSFLNGNGTPPAVSFNIAGKSGTITDTPAPAGDMVDLVL